MSPRRIGRRRGLAVALLICSSASFAQHFLGDTNSVPWDIEAGMAGVADSGAILTGGPSRPFSGFGYLTVQAAATSATAERAYGTATVVRGFNFNAVGARSLIAGEPAIHDGVATRRRIDAPEGRADLLRFYDEFTNFTARPIRVRIAIGGGLAWRASPRDPKPLIAATSSGDTILDRTDEFIVVATPKRALSAPNASPSVYGPASFIFGRAGAREGFGDSSLDALDDPYPGSDPARIAARYSLELKPGQTAALLTFVVRGDAETQQGKKPLQEVAKVLDTASLLLANPWLEGLSARERSHVVNWREHPGFEHKAPPGFSVVEATIAQTQSAVRDGRATAGELVRQYLDRIAAYDNAGPRLHAFISVNAQEALRVASEHASTTNGSGVAPNVGSLHGVVVAVKDNIDVIGMPTTWGTPLLSRSVAQKSAEAVRRLERAGAIVIGKTNLDELAVGGYGYSMLGGQTRNAYFPDRRPGGSSAGSAVAVAANLATVALGTDTCDSLTTPASLGRLVTLRPTHGLVSLDGVLPLDPAMDVLGPLARTVEDTARILDVLVGSDDTSMRTESSYVAALDRKALAGARIGVLKANFESWPDDAEMASTLARAFAVMREHGAVLIDLQAPKLAARVEAVWHTYPTDEFKNALRRYLSHAPGASIRSFEELMSRLGQGELSASSENYLRRVSARDSERIRTPAEFSKARGQLRRSLDALFNSHRLDAIVYPTNLVPPRRLEDRRYPFGNCGESATSGYPHVALPAGDFGKENFPVGLAFLGRPRSERRLLSLAYSFEQATAFRKPPAFAP